MIWTSVKKKIKLIVFSSSGHNFGVFTCIMRPTRLIGLNLIMCSHNVKAGCGHIIGQWSDPKTRPKLGFPTQSQIRTRFIKSKLGLKYLPSQFDSIQQPLSISRFLVIGIPLSYLLPTTWLRAAMQGRWRVATEICDGLLFCFPLLYSRSNSFN